jgi:glycosyltransferase involved in cell wall biosynthesis
MGSPISIIVPAHNEEALLGETLRTLMRSAAATGEPYEIIVVDDASSDRTAEVAADHGARVVSVNVRQIGAARNAGARAAAGDRLVFVDADTLVPEVVLGKAVEALRSGAVGGGAAARFDDDHPSWVDGMMIVVSWILGTARWAAGCFLFARRDAFERVGGFDERFFVSEEIHLSRALKKQGRFVIVPDAVVTSGRKMRSHTPAQMAWQFLRMMRPGGTRTREGLTFWYDQRKD